jgi:polyhydroxybutyrate depolymerase
MPKDQQTEGLVKEAVDVDGRQRTYWVARAERSDAPVLVVFHGLQGTGKVVAEQSGLGTRAPAAGITAVFPDGLRKTWDEGPESPARRRIGDADVRFMQALVDKVASPADGRRKVFLAGGSIGATFAEYLARHGHVKVSGLALVTGTAIKPSREAQPIPVQPATVVIFGGTGDPLVPYEGGRRGAGGFLGLFIALRAGRTKNDPSREVIGFEQLALDWAAANGNGTEPTKETIAPPTPDDLPVVRNLWSGEGRPSVTLYRVEDGGHVWPGTPPYPPERIFGRACAHLDAIEIILEMIRSRPD